MYSKAIIMGRLGKDPESRTTKEGKAMTSFTVAVSDGYGDKKKTTWYRVTVFGRQAEACNNYLHKGNVVLVDGTLSITEFTGKDNQNHVSVDILANSVTFMPKQEPQTHPQVQQPSYNDPFFPPGGYAEVDDAPF